MRYGQVRIEALHLFSTAQAGKAISRRLRGILGMMKRIELTVSTNTYVKVEESIILNSSSVALDIVGGQSDGGGREQTEVGWVVE